jgi:hypothetical protein
MEGISTAHSIIPAQPGYVALHIVTDDDNRPCEWVTGPIIAWAVHVKLEGNAHTCTTDPICDTDDQVAVAFQRPDGTVVLPHEGEYPNPDEALKYMQENHDRTERMRREHAARRNRPSP